MPGSQTQRHTTADGSANSAAGHKTPNPAATTAQPPASTGGQQHAQEQQAVPDDQVSDASRVAGSRRHPSGVISQLLLLSDTNAEESSSQDRQPSFGEQVSNMSWVMEQFWAGEDNVPIWARPMHASERAASAHGRARVLPIIADFDSYVPLFPRPR